MGHMGLKKVVIDSLKYSASNIKVVVLLGVILLITDLADELTYAGEMADELRLVFFLIVLILAIFEAGYVFKIIEDTIHGSSKLPKFDNIKLTFIHGIKELLVLFLYFIIPLALFFIFYLDFVISFDLNDVSSAGVLFFVLISCLAVTIYAFFPAVLLHRANNNGDLRSSFELKKIYLKIRSVGLKRLIVVYLGIFIIAAIVKEVLATSIGADVPLLGELITDLFVAPYLLIFTSRVLGLIDQPIDHS